MKYTLKRELFDKELVPSIRHMVLSEGSGMSAWIESVTKARESWMGFPPMEVTVAYVDDEPIGWAGLGSDFKMHDHKGFRYEVPVLSVYVLEDYRGHGIGTALLKNVLNNHKKHLKIGTPIAIDTERWDSRKHIESAGFCPMYYGDYYVDYDFNEDAV